MHSHYQMCTIFVGFSEFVLFFVLLKYAATTNCALYPLDFLNFSFTCTATTNCALYSLDFVIIFCVIFVCVCVGGGGGIFFLHMHSHY